MKTYRVSWEIDIDASSPVEAAKEALKIQRRKSSTANVFIVDGEQIDLGEYGRFNMGLVLANCPRTN